MFKYVFALLILIALVVGGGYYNYMRNAPMDNELQNRKYAAISTPDLDKMLKAYAGEIARAKGRVTDHPYGEGSINSVDSSDVGGTAAAFEKFQRENAQWKDRRGYVMEQEAMLKELQAEKSIRDRHLDDPMVRFKRRLLTF
jgi:hypothetical protein